jgi:YrbI family 3-deoxy-D-manno-octulosonate 8-phosphate phosphatase
MAVVAFIPVRGGSKSIPLKNIRDFCGQPLIYWNLKALEAAPGVDRVVVSTDSADIVNTVKGFGLSKVALFERSAESATDTASTETAMLDYLSRAGDQLKSDDLFMLVQATSPLTRVQDFTGALELFEKGGFDSLLTCVRYKRFFWNADGSSKNYDYRHRPRRQDFDGELMENGAFYISRVQSIQDSGNRLSGKIGIYEMPEYTAIEIDEEDDWLMAENLMRKHQMTEMRDFSKVKLFLTDVDGVLTDAGMYYTEKGDELKKFNTRDGMGLQLIRAKGIKTGIVTSEDTQIVERRFKKLKLDYLYQGKKHGGKLAAALDICKIEGIDISEVAYIGDDINCLELLSKAGFAACPADADQKVLNIPGIFVLSKRGGEGVVREFVEKIMNV